MKLLYQTSLVILSLILLVRCNNNNGTSIPKPQVTASTRFLIYDVNPGEGFNLRRDVYIRVANLVKHMVEKGEDWVLVLPPWSHLYHWKSRYLQQEATAWKNFFDIPNLGTYVPVMEFKDFVRLEGYDGIDHLIYLQMHPDTFTGGWKELIEYGDCKNTMYHVDADGHYQGYFWGLDDVYAKKYNCLNVAGTALILADFLKKLPARSIFVSRFEEVMHVDYGSVEFYKARRSLVFAKQLRNEGDVFRSKFLNSTDENDKTLYNEDWRKQVPKDSSALGGPYLGLHMRRGDFTYAHKETVPSIEEIGKEVDKMLKKYKLDVVYVSTDGTDKEVQELQSHFSAKILRFPRPRDVVKKFKDGGVAVIDQWIAAHSRYFIGTCLSTFSFRIHEERDILGYGERYFVNDRLGGWWFKQ